jgi:hypothetical protein
VGAGSLAVIVSLQPRILRGGDGDSTESDSGFVPFTDEWSGHLSIQGYCADAVAEVANKVVVTGTAQIQTTVAMAKESLGKIRDSLGSILDMALTDEINEAINADFMLHTLTDLAQRAMDAAAAHLKSELDAWVQNSLQTILSDGFKNFEARASQREDRVYSPSITTPGTIGKATASISGRIAGTYDVSGAIEYSATFSMVEFGGKTAQFNGVPNGGDDEVHGMIRAPDQKKEIYGRVQLKLEATVDWKLALGDAALKIEGKGGGTYQREVGDIKIEVKNHYQGVDSEKHGP